MDGFVVVFHFYSEQGNKIFERNKKKKVSPSRKKDRTKKKKIKNYEHVMHWMILEYAWGKIKMQYT